MNFFYHPVKVISIIFSGIILITVSGCSQNQDDIKLPVYDTIGGEFTLPGTLGEDVSLSDFRGQVVLLNFGYTHCPDICPMILNHLSKLTDKLTSRFGIKPERLKVIFVTVDPDRDTLEQLKEYLAFYNGNILGIRGSSEQTKELIKQYAVFVDKLPAEEIGYQVAHTDQIFLLDKRGRLRGLYDKAESEDILINDIISLVSADL